MITPTMHYGKIAGGRLDHEMQLAFLEAQTMGEHHGVEHPSPWKSRSSPSSPTRSSERSSIPSV